MVAIGWSTMLFGFAPHHRDLRPADIVLARGPNKLPKHARGACPDMMCLRLWCGLGAGIHHFHLVCHDGLIGVQ